MPRTAVLLQGYGGPAKVADVAPFMRNLTGREPSAEMLARVEAHYEAIGGGSPLLGIAEQIAERLRAGLASRGLEAPVRVGMRYWEPYIGDAVRALADEGFERIVAVSLSAFESQIATGAYRKALADVFEEHPHLEIVEAPLAGGLSAYADFFARSAREALGHAPAGSIVAFSAHSLPVADVVEDDPYVAGLRRTAAIIAEKLRLAAGTDAAGSALGAGFSAMGSDEAPNPWYLVYQSKGARPGEWLGPELDALIAAAAVERAPGVVVCPIGFMTDHMETLWDLDHVAKLHAEDDGIAFVRAAVPNTDDALVDALAESVIALM